MEWFRLERFQMAPKLVTFTRGFGNGSKRLQKVLQWRRECAATNYVITGAKCGCSPFEYFFVKMAAKNTKKLFNWTEEETALLLKVVLDYKTAELAIAQDWETIRSKYDDLAKRLIEAYPNELTDEFPRGQTKETLSAAKVSSKVKKLKNSFRKALDTGRKSGGGRIVSSLYKECSDIWAGCPAAICIDGGFETTALTETTDADEALSEENSPADTDPQEPSSSSFTENKGDDDYADDDSSTSCEPLKKKMKRRREELSKCLKDRRNSKITKQPLFKIKC